MRYSVLWSPDAEDRLAEIWLEAADRNDVTRAQAIVDEELATNPESKGTEVSEGLRRFKSEPLVVLFEIQTGARLVKVTAVRRSP
jgi:mRNA-degrading endonuclease RelE of RelBE toxin-antitoxin system